MTKSLPLVIAFSLSLAACSGGGVGKSSPAATAPISIPPASHAVTPTSFVIAKPPSTAAIVRAPQGRTPQYVTADITSISVALNSVDGGAPPSGLTTTVTTPITLANCPCTVPGPSVPPGSDVFTLTTYDASNAVVSTASATFTIAAGVANSNAVTLAGLPASFAITGVPSGTAGTAFSSPQTVTVAALDADGNTIVGTYASPLTISDSDASDLTLGTALSLNGGSAAHSVQSTTSSDVVKLSYGGLAIAPVTLTAAASGATNGTATFTPTLQPIVYTAGTGALSTDQINLYALSGTGSSGTFSVSEVGFSNAPYSQAFSQSLTGCSTIATAAPASGTTFTATVASSPVAGTCTLKVSDGGLHTALPITLTYTSSGIGVN